MAEQLVYLTQVWLQAGSRNLVGFITQELANVGQKVTIRGSAHVWTVANTFACWPRIYQDPALRKTQALFVVWWFAARKYDESAQETSPKTSEA